MAADLRLSADLRAGYKFDPSDEELVARYLVPSIRSSQLRPIHAAIIEADPLSAPPWELLGEDKDDAFLFAAAQFQSTRSGRGGRQKRTCAGGGMWQGQRVVARGENLRVPVGDGIVEVSWQKYALNFHTAGAGGAKSGSTGWVMHEYAVTDPPELASSPVRLCRVRFSGHGRKRARDPRDQPGTVHDNSKKRRTALEKTTTLLQDTTTPVLEKCNATLFQDTTPLLQEHHPLLQELYASASGQHDEQGSFSLSSCVANDEELMLMQEHVDIPGDELFGTTLDEMVAWFADLAEQANAADDNNAGDAAFMYSESEGEETPECDEELLQMQCYLDFTDHDTLLRPEDWSFIPT